MIPLRWSSRSWRSLRFKQYAEGLARWLDDHNSRLTNHPRIHRYTHFGGQGEPGTRALDDLQDLEEDVLAVLEELGAAPGDGGVECWYVRLGDP